MTDKTYALSEVKEELHPRNKHRGTYDFPKLIHVCPELGAFVSENQFQNLSIDFANPDAVKTLNKALLKQFYGIELWDIPEGFLCPPIPGRADYIHYVADLLKGDSESIPKGKTIKVLDIGIGANCIYPLIGRYEYSWNFIGSEIDNLAIRSASNIVDANGLSKYISIRKQKSANYIFRDIIHPGEKFSLSICNPPFHASMREAAASSTRKWNNLDKDRKSQNDLNFGGKNSELWCEGGEQSFLHQMITESAEYGQSVRWFTSLISKKETLVACYQTLKKLNVSDFKTIEMKQGQKISRILAWTFMP